MSATMRKEIDMFLISRAYKPIWKAKTKQFRSASILAVVTAAKILECDLICACHNDVPLFVPGTLNEKVKVR